MKSSRYTATFFTGVAIAFILFAFGSISASPASQSDGRDSAQMRELYGALEKSDAGKARALIQRWPRLARLRLGNTTALHRVIYDNGMPDAVRLDLARLLLSHGADVNALDGDHATPLNSSAENDARGHDFAMARLLLSHGANPDIADGGFRNTPLHWALIRSKPDVAAIVIDAGADVTLKGDGGNTPLHWAALSGYNDIVRKLVKRGAKVNVQNSIDETPILWALNEGHRGTADLLKSLGAHYDMRLHEAAKHGDSASVERLLKNSPALLETRDPKGYTPLLLASQECHLEVVRLLLRRGANPNYWAGKRYTALYLAAGSLKKDAPLVVKALLDGHAKIDARDYDCDTPILNAAQRGRIETVNFLVVRGASVNDRGGEWHTPLTHAIMAGRSDMVEFLIKNKAEVNGEDVYHETPVIYGVRSGNVTVIRLLLTAGASPKAQFRDGGLLLHYAVRSGSPEMVRALCIGGAPLNTRDSEGKTALCLGIEGRNLAIVRFLVERKADVNTLDSGGKSPFDYAGEKNKIEIIEILKSAGARPCAGIFEAAACGDTVKIASLIEQYPPIVRVKDGQTGCTPLIYSARARKREAMMLLMAGDADVGAKDQKGASVLHLAAKAGFDDVMNDLIGKGADVSAKDCNGNTPLHYAAMGGSAAAAKVLTEKKVELNVLNQSRKTPYGLALLYRHRDVAMFLRKLGAQ
jgi:ankyrin repeat protein